MWRTEDSSWKSTLFPSWVSGIWSEVVQLACMTSTFPSWPILLAPKSFLFRLHGGNVYRMSWEQTILNMNPSSAPLQPFLPPLGELWSKVTELEVNGWWEPSEERGRIEKFSWRATGENPEFILIKEKESRRNQCMEGGEKISHVESIDLDQHIPSNYKKDYPGKMYLENFSEKRRCT